MIISVSISKHCTDRTEAMTFWLLVQKQLEPVDGVILHATTNEEIGREVKNETT